MGVAEMSRFLKEQPPGTVLYDHWYSWHWRYHLFDSNVYVSWFPGPTSLVEDLNVFGGGEQIRYIALPGSADALPVIRAVEEAGFNWMIWTFVILGIFPFLSGIGSLIKYITRKRQLAQTRPRALEKTVLKAAADNGGELSVVQLAAAAELPLDEARGVLESMTAKGYVTQEVTDTGLVKYRFPLLDR